MHEGPLFAGLFPRLRATAESHIVFVAQRHRPSEHRVASDPNFVVYELLTVRTSGFLFARHFCWSQFAKSLALVLGLTLSVASWTLPHDNATDKFTVRGINRFCCIHWLNTLSLPTFAPGGFN